MKELVITRFAPSPTGMLHIGGARTALFNYLFAQKNKGKFLLRIEDTDIARSTDVAKQAILDGLQWLNLNFNDDIVYQSKNIERHLAVAEEMIKNGSAYYAYDSKEEIEKEREEAQKNKQQYKYKGKWRNAEANLSIPKDIKPVIRLKVPEGKTVVNDKVYGIIEFDNDSLEDLILVRSDGTPTYMLSVVVDDIDMGITHIIRGDDHLSNTPKQILIYNAIGSKPPVFAHIPLIYDISGKKLSKRTGAVSVEDYKHKGYLSKAVVSYLMKLGWTAKTEKDVLSIEEAASLFDFNDLGKSPSRFDFEKLNNINLNVIQGLTKHELEDIVLERMMLTNKDEIDRVKEIITSAENDLKKFDNIDKVVDLVKSYLYLPVLSDEYLTKLKDNKAIVIRLNDFFIKEAEYESFEPSFKNFLKENNYKFGEVGPLIRIILIGKIDSVGIVNIVNSLQKDNIVERFSKVTTIL